MIARNQILRLIVFTIIAFETHLVGGEIIYSGGSFPENEGWGISSFEGGFPQGSTVDKTLETDGAEDVMAVLTTGTWVDVHEYQTDYIQFLATFRIAVDQASHNSFDAGLMISGLTNQFQGLDRADSIYLLPDRIGFMDDSEPAFEVEPGVYHDYSLLITSSEIEVFVDESTEDILSGNAVSALARELSRPSQGIIYFGDQCNEPGVNSSYSIDYVRIEPISKVPEPTGSWLILGCIACVSRVVRIKNRKCW